MGLVALFRRKDKRVFALSEILFSVGAAAGISAPALEREEGGEEKGSEETLDLGHLDEVNKDNI